MIFTRAFGGNYCKAKFCLIFGNLTSPVHSTTTLRGVTTKTMDLKVRFGKNITIFLETDLKLYFGI